MRSAALKAPLPSNTGKKTEYGLSRPAQVYGFVPPGFEILSQLPVAIMVISKENNSVVFTNTALLETLCIQDKAVINQPLFYLLPQLNTPLLQQQLQQVWDTGKACTEKHILLEIKNCGVTEHKYADIQIAPIAHAGEGKPQQVMITFTDVTALVKKQHEALENEKYFRKMADSAPGILLLWRSDGYCVYKNKQWYQYTGLSTKQSEGFNWLNAVDTRNRVEVQLTLSEAIKNKTDLKNVFKLRRHDGEYRWFEQLATPYFDDNGSIAGYIGSITDIHENKIAKDLLEDAEERLRLALEASGIATFDVDLQSHTVISSPRLAEIYGLEKESYTTTIGQMDLLRRFYKTDKPILQKALKQAYRTGSYNFEARIVLPNDTLCWIKVMGKVFFNEQRLPVRMLGTVGNISKRKQLEQQKNEFMGIVSHELKTPVTALKVYTQLLQDKLNNHTEVAGASDMLRKMDAQVGRLHTLIKDLLDTARIDAGKLLVKQSLFNLNNVIKEAIEDVYMIGAGHTINCTDNESFNIMGDKERTRQVITNILTNAVKYSPHAMQINVSTRQEGNFVLCTIQDFGMGIPAMHLEDIFKKYYRINDNSGSTYPGLGLGLFIAQQIIRLQGGNIWAESTEGKGTCFWFSLPLYTAG